MTQLTTDTDDPERRTEHKPDPDPDPDYDHNHENDLSFGDIVIDRERSDSKNKKTENNNKRKSETGTDTHRAVVVNVPPVTAEEWDVFDRGTTVAEDNPQYRSDAPIAIVVFMPELDSEFNTILESHHSH